MWITLIMRLSLIMYSKCLMKYLNERICVFYVSTSGYKLMWCVYEDKVIEVINDGHNSPVNMQWQEDHER